MSVKNISSALAVLGALGIIYIGVNYMLNPVSMAASFGLPTWPTGDAAAYLNLKGIRDLTSGLIILIVLVTGQRRALGWILLVGTVTPFGDAITVLTHGGSTAIAFGVHGATAVSVLVIAGLVFYAERRDAKASNTMTSVATETKAVHN